MSDALGTAVAAAVGDQEERKAAFAAELEKVEPLSTTEATEAIEGDQHNRRVRDAIRTIRINEEAREIVASEKAGEDWKPPVSLGISDFLAVEPSAPSFHVRGLWPHGGMVVLVAAKKWGKTTNVRHTVECSLTGSPLFGQFEIDSPFKRALVIDNELSERQAWDMWNGTPLTNDQLTIWRQRESLSSLGIRSEYVRRNLVAQIRDTGADLLVVDPLGPLLRANEWEENSNSDVGSCLDLLAEMAADAGVTSVLIPHHTGHSGTNARGASVLGDKADAIWTGTLKKPADPYGPRLFGAIGRSGVSQKPVELSWDETTRLPYIDADALEGLSEVELEAGRRYSLFVAVEKVVASGITTVTGVREAIRDDGFKVNNALIDSVREEVLRVRP